MEWISFFDRQPEDGQKIWYYGIMLKTLSDICPCGKCDMLVYTYDRDYGIIWHYCAECHWWYVGN